MRDSAFNKYGIMPFIPYKIIEYLANSKTSNDIFKALKYETEECLSMKDLTLQEKISMVYKNQPVQTKYNIFLSPLVSNELTNSTTQLRINKFEINPSNHLTGVVSYAFSILTSDKISIIDYVEEDGMLCPVNRVDYIEWALLRELNGINIGGIGALQFNNELSRNCRSRYNINNGKSYWGNTIIFSTIISDIGGDKSCLG